MTMVSYPVTSELMLGQRGPDWVAFDYRTTVNYGMGMAPQVSSVSRISGTAQIGSIWIAPAALAKLRAGQPIDTDPYTQVQTLAKYVGPSQSRRPVAVIAERLPGLELEYGYDLQTGQMTSASLASQAGIGQTRTEVRLIGQQ